MTNNFTQAYSIKDFLWNYSAVLFIELPTFLSFSNVCGTKGWCVEL